MISERLISRTRAWSPVRVVVRNGIFVSVATNENYRKMLIERLRTMDRQISLVAPTN